MKLTNLKLQNFRSHIDFKIEFSDNTVVFLGKNTVGKTNIIESIRYLSLFKSFRSSSAKDMINWKSSFARAEGDFFNDKIKTNITSVLIKKGEKSPIKRQVKLNGSLIPTRKAVGNFLTVIFSPDDIRLISSSPSKRRKYLDTVLGQLSKRYYSSLLAFNRALEQRNTLLSGNSSINSIKDVLGLWDEQFAREGSYLIKKRADFIEILNKKLPINYKEIGGTGELKLEYQPRLLHPGLLSLASEEEIKKLLLNSLQSSLAKDIILGTTSIGPHRDDFQFNLNNRDINTHGSRGEFRSTVLALKIGEKEFINEITTKTPVLLLDDVFSELDIDRRYALSKKISDSQSFITTTDLDNLGDHFLKKSQIIELPLN